MTRKLFSIVLVLLVLLVLAVFSAQELKRRWQQPLMIPATGFQLTVAAGDSLRAVVGKLHAEGILDYPNLVILYARWTGDDQRIKHGEYLLPPQATITSLLELLMSGRVIQYQVTLPEGISLGLALAILAQQTELAHVIESTEDSRILELVMPYPHPEGLFFPDTYQFSRDATDLQILQRAHLRMLDVLEQEWQDRAPELPYSSAYEALIMASIIERETGLPEEREQIAGVFVRRLQAGIRLQTDPTVIYGIGSDFDGNLKRTHLTDNANPYNTYRQDGLPPTPIALPGRAAIHAAMHPADGSTLFFVARGDGGHDFSVTLAEHESAVRKYQLQRREDYRSAPPEKP